MSELTNPGPPTAQHERVTGLLLSVAKAMYETKFFQQNLRWEDADHSTQWSWVSLAGVAVEVTGKQPFNDAREIEIRMTVGQARALIDAWYGGISNAGGNHRNAEHAMVVIEGTVEEFNR